MTLSRACFLRLDSGFFPKSYARFSMILQNTLYAIYIVRLESNLSNKKWLMINFIISVTVVSIFGHTPLQVVWFVVCICYTSDPKHFLHCFAVDIPDQQLYARPKGGMRPLYHPAAPHIAQITDEVRDSKQALKNWLGSG